MSTRKKFHMVLKYWCMLSILATGYFQPNRTVRGLKQKLRSLLKDVPHLKNSLKLSENTLAELSSLVLNKEPTPRQRTRKERIQERSGPDNLLPESPQPAQKVNARIVEEELASVVAKEGKIIEFYTRENRRLREDVERRGANEEWKERYEAERRRREEVEKKYQEKNKQIEQTAAKRKEQEGQAGEKKREQEKRAAERRVVELEREVLKMKEERKKESNQERNKAEELKKERDELRKELDRAKVEIRKLEEENKDLKGTVSTAVVVLSTKSPQPRPSMNEHLQVPVIRRK